MAGRISGFRTPEGAARFLERYDDIAARLWPVAHEELDVDSRLGTTHVRRSGPEHGIPIVLIHPTTGSSVGWYPVVGPLCEHHPVYTPDTLGTAGRSVQREPIRSSGDLVTWLDDVLDALELGPVHLLGYSEGGWIAGLHAAITERPDRLVTVTLVEPGGAVGRIPRLFIANLVLRGARALLARDKPRAIRELNRWMNGDVELTDEQIELLLLAMRTFRQKLPSPGRLSDEELQRITVPSLLVFGSDTKLYDPEEVADRARRLMGDVRVEITPNAGHGVLFQYPELITAHILRFIDERERTADPPST
jgi:pimeloyl-ACP methyl ester carboxylesterase